MRIQLKLSSRMVSWKLQCPCRSRRATEGKSRFRAVRQVERRRKGQDRPNRPVSRLRPKPPDSSGDEIEVDLRSL